MPSGPPCYSVRLKKPHDGGAAAAEAQPVSLSSHSARTSRPPRLWLRFLAAIAIFAAMEALLFHTDLYPSILEPESTTGTLEALLREELARPMLDWNQVLILGHSQMGILPRVANELTGQTGYTFGSVAMGGTNPRVWYYQVRTVDPERDRYSAIVLPAANYDEPDSLDDLRDSETDLHYLLARLRLADAFDFPWTFASRDLRWKSFLGIFFKGHVLKSDFLAFLQHPFDRIEKVRLYRREGFGSRYRFTGEDGNLAGLTVDWEHKTAHFPENLTPEQRQLVENVLFQKRPPDRGIMTAYCREWYGRIADYYRGSRTKIIFLRPARAPVPPPPFPRKPHSAVRELASRPNVFLIDEHFLDELERPELFGDPLHLNRNGLQRFSHMVAAEVGRILGPPKS
jgi:hypothetical protein